MGVIKYRDKTYGSSGGDKEILTGTKDYWNNEQRTLISQDGVLYVYTDYMEDDGEYIPGLKIGDGNAYLIDLPFQDTIYAKHIVDTRLHVSDAEREFWNNKVTCFIDPENENKIIFSKE